jgi:hypothetical protein
VLTAGCLFLARYVAPRVNAPIEYWRTQQQRYRSTVFLVVYILAGASAALAAALLASDAPFAAGVLIVPACFFGFVTVGKVTGQFGDY